jgi:hypothetical protein
LVLFKYPIPVKSCIPVFNLALMKEVIGNVLLHRRELFVEKQVESYKEREYLLDILSVDKYNRK